MMVAPHAIAEPLGRLLHQVPCVVWATDVTLMLTQILGAIPRFGAAAARFSIGQTIYDFCGTTDPLNPILAAHLAALAGQRQCRRQKFGERWFEAILEPLRDEEGQIVGCAGAAVEVTERRVAEERLEESQARLADAQRIAHIGSFEWDVDRDVVVWSDEMYRIYGIEKDEFGGTFSAFLAHIPANEVDRLQAKLFETLHTHGTCAFDHRIARPDGSIRILHTKSGACRDEETKRVRVVGSCWDVTELRETTTALEQSVSLLHATLDATADGILVVDRSGKVSAVNARFRELWRIPEAMLKEAKDHQLLDFVRDQLQEPESFICQVRDIYAHPEMESFAVLRFNDGRAFERHSRPQRVGNAVVGRVWSFHDITDRERLLRRAELLADSSRLLTSLDVESAMEAVARLAAPLLGDGCAIDLFGNGGPRRVVSPSDDGRAPFAGDLNPAVLAGKSVTYSSVTSSHLAVPLTIKGTLLGAMTFVAAREKRFDPFEIELAEELAGRVSVAVENVRLLESVQVALRAREEFLSVAAHEIRGPLTSIHLAAQKLSHGCEDTTAKHLLGVIVREDRRLGRFVEELLDLGRIQTGQLRFQMEKVNLAHIVHDAIVRLAPEISASGSSISLDLDENTVGEWDRFRMEQVVNNLIANAIKFGQGEPIQVTLSQMDSRAFFVVKDRGIGIDPEMHERIFKPFERQASVRNYGGLGLGLYIVRTIVEGMGGTVSVESAPDTGAQFTVELPCKGTP